MAIDANIQGQIGSGPGQLSVFSSPAPATNPQATVAANPNKRHIARSITVGFAAVAAQGAIYACVRDGALGSGTILWKVLLGVFGVGQNMYPTSFDLFNLVGTANTAMSAEFCDASGTALVPAATNVGSITLEYWDAA